MLLKRSKSGLGKLFIDAHAEAMRRGDRKIGTEHLLLALVADPGAPTAQAMDVTLDGARDALSALDREALRAVGVDTTFGPPIARKPGFERFRLTPAAKAVFAGLKTREKGERPDVHHVLHGLLLQQRPDPAAELLDELGVDRETVRQRLTAR